MSEVWNREVAGNNKLVSICHTIEAAIISVAYLMEFVKGARTIEYVLISLLIVLSAPAVDWVLYKKKKDTPLIKYVAGFGFCVFYLFAMLTTTNKLVFVYAIPLLTVLSIYNELKFFIKLNVCVIVINFIQAADYIFFSETWNVKDDLAALEIQILVMILIAVFSMIATSTMAKYNRQKIGEINEKTDHVEVLLTNVMEVSKGLTKGIDEIHGKMGELDDSMRTTKDAMQQVSAGTNDTAKAVQKQLERTDDIQVKVGDVKERTDAINRDVSDMLHALDEGNKTVRKLLDETNESIQTGKEVAVKLNELNTIMEDMNTVVSLITDITSQTSMLALNASIEAARAGEAGKGFSVVASEISKMANDTESATIKITDMINSVTEAIEDVVSVTGKMMTEIDEQSEATTETADSFNMIEKSIGNVKENSNNLTKIVGLLDTSNKEIVDSISTISAISEEVSAHAEDTVSVSVNNIKTVANLSAVVNEMKELAEKLNEA